MNLDHVLVITTIGLHVCDRRLLIVRTDRLSVFCSDRFEQVYPYHLATRLRNGSRELCNHSATSVEWVIPQKKRRLLRTAFQWSIPESDR
ncbi:MAG TPA: hypothetical protein PL070_05500, partial [Flavobacteriales bacterium]|nr:hypothetical protein [Flavobacteriales bacterium]